MYGTSHTIDPEIRRQLEELNRKIVSALLQFLDGTMIINPRLFYKIYEGYGFSVSHRFEGVGAGSSVDVYFENPSNSGRQVFLVVVEVVSLAQAYIDIYRGNTVTVSGTALTPVNLNFEKNIPSVVNVEHGGTYGLGTLTLNTVCPGGSKKEAIGGNAEVGETAVIPEGFNFLVRLTNQSASATDLSVRILWWEEP